MGYRITFCTTFLQRYIRNKFQSKDLSNQINKKQKRLNKIYKYATNNSEYYRELYKNTDFNTKDVNIEKLPIINKESLVDNFDKIVTNKEISKEGLKKYFEKPFNFKNKYLNKYLAFHTSGSTGNTAYVVWGAREFAIASYMLLTQNTKLLRWNCLLDMVFRRKKYAYVGIMDDYVGGNSWVYSMRFLTNLKMLSIFSPINELCTELNKFQPEVIMTKPHILGELAIQKLEGSLNISPERIIFVGEMLNENDEHIIEKAFGMKPYNSYSTCETGPIAVQEGTAKAIDVIKSEILLELIGDDGNIINDYYKEGRIVITNFYNKIMPIIRYDLGDRAYYIPSDNSSNTSRISYIQGRKTRFFIFENGSENEIKVSEFAFWSLYVKGVRRYQVIQDTLQSIKIKIEWEKNFNEKSNSKAMIEKKIYRIFSQDSNWGDIKIYWEEVEKIYPNKSGKIKITFPI